MGSGQKITSINNKKPPSAENQREHFYAINAFVMGVRAYLLASSTATVRPENAFSSADLYSIVYCECIVYWSVMRFSESVAIKYVG